MQSIKFMSRYIRNNYKICLLGLLIPAFSSMGTNIFYADRLERYSTMLMSSKVSILEVAHMLILTIIGLLVLSGIDDLGRYILEVFSATVENNLKNDLFSRMVCAPLNKMQKFNQGELITRYDADATKSADIISYDIHGLIYPIIVGTGYTIAVLTADYFIGIIMLTLGVAVIALNFFFVSKITEAEKKILQAKEEYALNCNDAIQGKISIRQYSAKHMMNEKIMTSCMEILQEEKAELRLQTIKLLTSDCLANICTYLLTPLACVFAVYGYISVPTVLFIHQICRCFIMYTQNFAATFIRLNTHAVSFGRIHPILQLNNEIKKDDECRKKKVPNNAVIDARQVNVFYGKKHILKNVSFSIDQGEIVGLVGESGSGKSTLVKALLQMIDYQGKILIGKEDCTNISIEDLRTNIGYVPEQSELLNTTVYENIQFGNLKASKKDIVSAMKRAAICNAEEFLYRKTGENGDRLSGGEKQRISIARALLKNAPIIILDEPTSALDSRSEEKILQTILDLKNEGKSILLITHKASTLRISDRILCIEEGKIKEKTRDRRE